MQALSQADYVTTYFTLYDRFQQEQGCPVHYGHPFDYEDKVLIVFFAMAILALATPVAERSGMIHRLPFHCLLSQMYHGHPAFQ